MDFSVIDYKPQYLEDWNATLLKIKQQCMLFSRSYMDYHADRFADCSLLIADSHHRIVALFPACENPDNTAQIISHAGLTFGGLLTTEALGAESVFYILKAICTHYKTKGYEHIVIRCVPYIYHTAPAEADLYWLFQHGAKLSARALSTAIDLRHTIPLSTLRRRKVKRAQRQTEQFVISDEICHLSDFWKILTQVLDERHGTRPTHTYSEILRLMKQNPDNIQLYTILTRKDDGNEEVLAGIITYRSSMVEHLQYIAASERGRTLSALDFLIAHHIQHLFQDTSNGLRYLDFGISTEQQGKVLNVGLQFQKEGFGARSVTYDTYEIEL